MFYSLHVYVMLIREGKIFNEEVMLYVKLREEWVISHFCYFYAEQIEKYFLEMSLITCMSSMVRNFGTSKQNYIGERSVLFSISLFKFPCSANKIQFY